MTAIATSAGRAAGATARRTTATLSRRPARRCMSEEQRQRRTDARLRGLRVEAGKKVVRLEDQERDRAPGETGVEEVDRGLLRTRIEMLVAADRIDVTGELDDTLNVETKY